jgi:hypothetical protein
MKRVRAGWKRPGLIITAALLGLVVLGLVGLKVSSSSGMKQELEAIQNRGLPTSAIELDAWYKQVPAEENAALLILKASEHFVQAAEGNDPRYFSRRDMPLGDPLLPEILAAAEDFVGKNAETLKVLREVPGLSRSRYPTDLSKAPNFTSSHLMHVKKLAQLLRWEAILKAENKDEAGALQSLISGFAAAGSLKDEPLLISSLVRIACLAIHMEGLERSVTHVQFDDVSLKQLAEEARKAEEDGKRAVHRTVAGERAFALASFKDLTYDTYAQMVSFGGAPAGYDELPEFLREVLYNVRHGLGMHDRDVAFYVQSSVKLEGAAELDFPKMLEEADRAYVEISAELTAHPIKYMISSLALPATDKWVTKEVQIASKLRCARAALMIERFRLRHDGRLPRADELVPHVMVEWPRDAADDEPLKFEPHETNGYRVVAIAAFRLANEGRSTTSTNWQDVAFTVNR